MDRIREKYKDSGTSGKAQMKKELKALDAKVERQADKIHGKEYSDSKNVKKYGKDAMKSRGFAAYNKGGMVKSNCGASMKPNGRAKK